jgi:hypothetical protein
MPSSLRFRAASAPPTCVYTAGVTVNSISEEWSPTEACGTCSNIESPLRSDPISSPPSSDESDHLQLGHMFQEQLSLNSPTRKGDSKTPKQSSPVFSSPSNVYFDMLPSTIISRLRYPSMSINTMLSKDKRTALNLHESHSAIEDPFTDPLPTCSPFDPTTWPTIHLPYHSSAETSIPTNIAEMRPQVHYQGAGLKILEALVFHAIETAQTEEEKCAIELQAYLCWPCNVSASGHWKKSRKMAEGEVERWRQDMEAWGREHGFNV